VLAKDSGSVVLITTSEELFSPIALPPVSIHTSPCLDVFSGANLGVEDGGSIVPMAFKENFSPLASPPTSSLMSDDDQDELLEFFMDELAFALCDAIEATVVTATTLVPISLPLCEESTLALCDAIEETTPVGLSRRWYLETLWDLGHVCRDRAWGIVVLPWIDGLGF